MKLFVEGGGDSSNLRALCREGFRKFLESSGVEKFPRIVASGARDAAYKDFCTEMKQNGSALLLVDSEEPIQTDPEKPWLHLKTSDNWEQPADSLDSQCHLMVVCMESWLVSDKVRLGLYYGQDFRANAMPQNARIEELSKSDVLCPIGNGA